MLESSCRQVALDQIMEYKSVFQEQKQDNSKKRIYFTTLPTFSLFSSFSILSSCYLTNRYYANEKFEEKKSFHEIQDFERQLLK
jgi:hypothetical protein